MLQRIVRSMSLGLALLCTLSAAVAAQAPAQPRVWFLHQELARPPALAQYEATTREFMAAVARHKALMPHFNIAAAFEGEDFLFTYAIPIQSFADVDALTSEFGALAQAEGPAFAGLLVRSGATIDNTRESVMIEPLDLGYRPAMPRLKPEEVEYLHSDLYYVQPGREAEADLLARDFAALFKSKGVRDGYRLFKVWLGNDASLYLVQVGARDAADFAVADAESRKLLGKEGEALFARANALCRRVEHRNDRFRGDLLPPPAGK